MRQFTVFHYQYIHLQSAFYVIHCYIKVHQSNFSVDCNVDLYR
jgi:hypothetical protein